MNLERIKTLLVEILYLSGNYLLNKNRKSIYNKKIGNQIKSNADIEVENLIVNFLKKNFSQYPIVTEEDASSYKYNKEKDFWLIDPIDGTASFIEGYDSYVIQIALMKNKMPLISGIYAPALDMMFVAEKNKGVSLNGKKLPKLSSNFSSKILIDNYSIPKGFTKKLYESLECDQYVECGSFGLKICMVALGRANIFVKNVIYKDWDVAPGNLIITELNGILVDFNGKELIYGKKIDNNEGLIVTANDKLLREILSKIEFK